MITRNFPLDDYPVFIREGAAWKFDEARKCLIIKTRTYEQGRYDITWP